MRNADSTLDLSKAIGRKVLKVSETLELKKQEFKDR